MRSFSDEEMKVLKDLIARFPSAFFDPLFVAGHPFYNQPKKRRRFMRRLGAKNAGRN